MRMVMVWRLAAGVASFGAACALGAQAAVPIVELPAASAKSASTFGSIATIRELPDGSLLVNDAARKQVALLNASLASVSFVYDTARGQPNFYGPRIMPLIPYLGDSTLFPDLSARVVAVLDPRGRVARSMAMPTANDVFFLRRAGVDANGRLIFAAEPAVTSHDVGKTPAVSDSAPLVRADFALRRNDTIAYVARPLARADATPITGAGAINAYFNPDPLRTLDEWAVLTDGSLAMLRAHDYHVDFVRPDGTKASSSKLPFDWRALTDADKEKMIDSAQNLRVLAARNNTLVNGVEKVVQWNGTGRGGEAGKGTAKYPSLDTAGALISKNNGGGDVLVFAAPRPTIDRVFDYYPPVRDRAVMADLDNHLWILPTTSKQSKAGELVYDVVNAKGQLFERVRVPLGRYIVGFGRHGVVYLASGGTTNGFVIERTALPNAK